MKTKQRLQELLTIYFSDTASPADKKELWTYVNDPLFSETIQAQIGEEFENPGDAPGLSDGKHNDILEEIFETDKTETQKITRRLWPRIAAAASIVIALGVGAYFLTNHKSTGQQTAQSQPFKNDILPGGNKAILTLANGERISLTDATNGNIANQTGVTIRKAANGQLVYDVSNTIHSESAKPEYNTVEAPAGGQWQVILPDGSHVWLNALSSLTYPTIFTGNERKVTLKGEAYFEISHDKLKPFRVASKDQTVEVLGTHFNITAYDDEKIIKTTLLEGSVKITEHNKSKLLIPGEQASVETSQIKVTNDIDLEEVVAWKNGYFKFHESLESIMNKVARWYDVEIVYRGNVNRTRAYGAEVPRTKDITTLLNIIESTETVHFKIEGRRVIVMQ